MTKQLASKSSAYEGGMAAHAKAVANGVIVDCVSERVAFHDWTKQVEVARDYGPDSIRRWAIWKAAFQAGWRDAQKRAGLAS
mgnify:CR=1 FL=1